MQLHTLDTHSALQSFLLVHPVLSLSGAERRPVAQQPCETDTDIMETTRATTFSPGFLFSAFHISVHAAMELVFLWLQTQGGRVEIYEICLA